MGKTNPLTVAGKVRVEFEVEEADLAAVLDVGNGHEELRRQLLCRDAERGDVDRARLDREEDAAIWEEVEVCGLLEVRVQREP